MLGDKKEEFSSRAKFKYEVEVVFRLKSTVHLYDKWMLFKLELFKDPPLSHNLHNFIVLLDSVLAHYLHSIELPSSLVSNKQNFREPSFTNNLLYKIVIK